MTIEEIRSCFDAEWVLLADPEVDAQMDIVSGRVVAHSKDRDEVDRKAVALHLKNAAFLYTGRMPENTAIVL